MIDGATDQMPAFAQVQAQFARHLRAPYEVEAPASVPASRMALYRELVHGNVARMLGNLFPVLRRTLPEPAWEALLNDFFRRHACRTGVFTQVPQEFVQFMTEAREPGQDPPYVRELVHYEWVDYAAGIDPREIDDAGVDRDGDLLAGVPVLNPLTWLLSYRYPVHRIGPEYQPTEPPETPTYLVVCRDRADEVGFIDLNPVTARLLELIQQAHGIPGHGLLERIALELSHPDPDAVVAGGRDILQRLRARDVLLGAVTVADRPAATR